VNNLGKRSLTAVFFVVAMVGSILLGQTVFAVLLFIITVLSISEFNTITAGITNPTLNWPVTLTGGTINLLLAGNALHLIPSRFLLIAAALIFLLFITELFKKSEQPFTRIAYSLGAIIYIAVPLGLINYFFNPMIISGPYHFGIALGFFLMLWLNDTGAYFVGSLIGKHKLFERISPGKTWEGSIGGAVFALLTAWGLSAIFHQLSWAEWAGMGLVVVVTGTLGDLVESMLKRSLGIKDSGKILPGHGGMLDRFDAVLLSAPFVFVYLSLICW
jgi:phosphatidate cytidylyltransferase